MSALQFSRSWHIWRGSAHPYRYSFGRVSESTVHAKGRRAICLHACLLIALIMKLTHSPTLQGHLSHQFNPPQQLSASWFRSVAIIVICNPTSPVHGGGTSDLLLITCGVTSRLCYFQLHHNPLVSCRREAETQNFSIWSTNIRCEFLSL